MLNPHGDFPGSPSPLCKQTLYDRGKRLEFLNSAYQKILEILKMITERKSII